MNEILQGSGCLVVTQVLSCSSFPAHPTGTETGAAHSVLRGQAAHRPPPPGQPPAIGASIAPPCSPPAGSASFIYAEFETCVSHEQRSASLTAPAPLPPHTWSSSKESSPQVHKAPKQWVLLGSGARSLPKLQGRPLRHQARHPPRHRALLRGQQHRAGHGVCRAQRVENWDMKIITHRVTPATHGMKQ